MPQHKPTTRRDQHDTHQEPSSVDPVATTTPAPAPPQQQPLIGFLQASTASATQPNTRPRGVPARRQQRAMLSLQRLHGNRAARQAANVVQRQGGFSVKKRGKDKYTINAPFNYGKATTYEEMTTILNTMAVDLNTAAESFGSNKEAANVKKALDKIDELLYTSIRRSGDIIESDADAFMRATPYFYDTLKAIVQPTRDDFVKAMQQFQADTSKLTGTQRELAEALHFAFVGNADESVAKKLKGSLDAVEKYKKEVDDVISDARTLEKYVGYVELPKFVEKIEKASTKFGKFTGKIGNMLQAADLMLSFSDNVPSENLQMINQFQNTINAIDFGMGFVKQVPALGMMWSKYYKPLTDQCIKQMTIIAKAQDAKERQYGALIGKTSKRDPSGAPVIPKEALGSFPGGQPVMNYMWPLVNGQRPAQMEPEALNWFEENAERLNRIAGDGEVKMDISGPELTDPTTWLDETKVYKLEPFLQQHQSTVWAMLYGDLPKDI